MLATCLVPPEIDPDGAAVGATVGNRPSTLPPGLSVEPGVVNPAGRFAPAGKVPPPMGDPDVPVAVTATGADADGPVTRPVALLVAVKLTEVTVAVDGTVSCAWSCRCAEAASTVPRRHVDAPLPDPQPKVNCAVPVPAGLTCNASAAFATFPPVAQAATDHWAAWPGALLGCTAVTEMHRSTATVAAWAPPCAATTSAIRTAGCTAPPFTADFNADVDVVDVDVDVVDVDVAGADVVGAADVDEAGGDAVTVCVTVCVTVGVGVGVGLGWALARSVSEKASATGSVTRRPGPPCRTA